MAKFVVYEKAAEAIFRQYPKENMSSGMQTTANLGAGLKLTASNFTVVA